MAAISKRILVRGICRSRQNAPAHAAVGKWRSGKVAGAHYRRDTGNRRVVISGRWNVEMGFTNAGVHRVEVHWRFAHCAGVCMCLLCGARIGRFCDATCETKLGLRVVGATERHHMRTARQQRTRYNLVLPVHSEAGEERCLTAHMQCTMWRLS